MQYELIIANMLRSSASAKSASSGAVDMNAIGVSHLMRGSHEASLAKLSAEVLGMTLERDALKVRCDSLTTDHEQILVEAERRFQIQQTEMAALTSQVLVHSNAGHSSVDASVTRNVENEREIK